MKIFLSIWILCLSFLTGIASAGQINLGGGYGPQGHDKGRQHNGVFNISYTFYESSRPGSLQFLLGIGYSYIFTDTKYNEDVHVFSVLPALRYHLPKRGNFSPFLEVKIGPSYISEKHLGNQDKGEHFTFNDFFTIGFRWGKEQEWEFTYSYQHLSNGSLFHPNQGWDIPFTLHIGRQF